MRITRILACALHNTQQALLKRRSTLVEGRHGADSVRYAAGLFGERVEFARKAELVEARVQLKFAVRDGGVLNQLAGIFEDGVENLHASRDIPNLLPHVAADQHVVMAAFRMADDAAQRRAFRRLHVGEAVRRSINLDDGDLALGADLKIVFVV